MKAIVSLLLVAFIGISPVQTYATEWPTDEELEGAEEKPLIVEEEEPYELDELTVIGERFTLQQETALRFVRQGLKTPRSYKREGKDIWTCRFRSPVGTHHKYLECARNGDLNALMYQPVYPRFEKGKNYGTIWRSQRPVNKKDFEAMLASLPGTDDLDKEFVALANSGIHTPRDIPSDEELDEFADAYRTVSKLDSQGTDEASILAAITESGLTLNRYNRLIELIETYQSLENEVAFRLGTLERPNNNSVE